MTKIDVFGWENLGGLWNSLAEDFDLNKGVTRIENMLSGGESSP